MDIKARTLWPDILVFERWINRNCKTCRQRYNPNHNAPDRGTCSVASKCLTYCTNDQTVPELVLEIIFGSAYRANVNDHTVAPYTCNSRKDRRGRPAHH